MNICRSKDGHVKLWHKINDSDIGQDNNAFLVFTKMLFFAHYEDNFTSIRFGGKQYKLKAGEFSATLGELAALVNLPQSTLRKVLDRLETDKRISRRTDRQTTIFSICKWSLYQGDKRGKRTNEVANERTNEVANEVANVTEGKKNIKNIKNIDTNVSMVIQKSPSTDINEMFELWKEINGYAIDGQQKSNRYACSNLIKKYGKDGLEQMIRGVSLAQQDKYAPRISDFSSLQAKQNDLIAWGKTKQIATMKKVAII